MHDNGIGGGGFRRPPPRGKAPVARTRADPPSPRPPVRTPPPSRAAPRERAPESRYSEDGAKRAAQQRRLGLDSNSGAPKRADASAQRLDDRLPARARTVLLENQAKLEKDVAAAKARARHAPQAHPPERKVRAEYWSRNEHYVDPETKKTYLASYSLQTGELTLRRDDEAVKGDDGKPAVADTVLTLREDGSSHSQLRTYRKSKAGRETRSTWERETSPSGKLTQLTHTQEVEELRPESGRTRTVTTQRFNVDRLGDDEALDKKLPLESQTVRVELEHGTLEGGPEGPGVIETVTEFHPNGAPARELTRLMQSSADFDADQVRTFEEQRSDDLARASADKFSPDRSQDGQGLPIGAQSVSITDETLFNTRGEGVFRSQRRETLAIGAVGEHGVTVLRGTRSTRWGDAAGLSVDELRTRAERLSPLAADQQSRIEETRTLTTFDPEGSTLRPGFGHREVATERSTAVGTPEGEPLDWTHEPQRVRVIAEGADDDWTYDELQVDRNTEGAQPRSLHHEQDLDWHEEGVFGAVKNNLGTISAALSTAGLALQVLPLGVNNAVGAVLIAAGMGAAALDTAQQAHAAWRGLPGGSLGNVALAGMGLIPGASVGAALRAAKAGAGAGQVGTMALREVASVVNLSAAGVQTGRVAQTVASGEVPTAQELLLLTGLALGGARARQLSHPDPGPNPGPGPLPPAAQLSARDLSPPRSAVAEGATSPSTARELPSDMFSKDGAATVVNPRYTQGLRPEQTRELVELRASGQHDALLARYAHAVVDEGAKNDAFFDAMDASPGKLAKVESDALQAAQRTLTQVRAELSQTHRQLVTGRTQAAQSSAADWKPSTRVSTDAEVRQLSGLAPDELARIEGTRELADFREQVTAYQRAKEDHESFGRLARVDSPQFLAREAELASRLEATRSPLFVQSPDRSPMLLATSHLRRLSNQRAAEATRMGRLEAGELTPSSTARVAAEYRAEWMHRPTVAMTQAASTVLSYRPGTLVFDGGKLQFNTRRTDTGELRNQLTAQLARIADAEDLPPHGPGLRPNDLTARANWLTRLQQEGVKVVLQTSMLDDGLHRAVQQMKPKERTARYHLWYDAQSREIHVRDTLADGAVNATRAPAEAVLLDDVLESPRSVETFLDLVHDQVLRGT